MRLHPTNAYSTNVIFPGNEDIVGSNLVPELQKVGDIRNGNKFKLHPILF